MALQIPAVHQHEADERGLEHDLRPQRARLQGGERREGRRPPGVRAAHGGQHRGDDPGRPRRGLEQLDQADRREHEAAEPVDGARDPGAPRPPSRGGAPAGWRRSAPGAGAARHPGRAAPALPRAGAARGPRDTPAASARRRRSWDSTAARRRGEGTRPRRRTRARSTSRGRGSRGGVPRRARRRTATGRPGGGPGRPRARPGPRPGGRSRAAPAVTARSAGPARPRLVMLGAHVSIRPVTRWRAVGLLCLLLTAWTGALYARAALSPPPGLRVRRDLPLDRRLLQLRLLRAAVGGRGVPVPQQARARERPARDPEPRVVAPRTGLPRPRATPVPRLSPAGRGRDPGPPGGSGAMARSGGGPVLAPPGRARCSSSSAGGSEASSSSSTDRPAARCPDLSMAWFPFLEVLANPHFVIGTALLVWALWCFEAVPAPRGPLPRLRASERCSACVRPYDAALLAGVEGLAVVLTSPRAGVAATPPAAWRLSPRCSRTTPGSCTRPSAVRLLEPYAAVGLPPADLAIGLGPAVLLALTALRRRDGEGARGAPSAGPLGRARARGRAAAAGLRSRLQFGVGVGVPLLVLGAAGLASLAAPLHRSRRAAACRRARSSRRGSSSRTTRTGSFRGRGSRRGSPCAGGAVAGDRVLAPPDIGLYVHGLTACDAFVSHPAAPGLRRSSRAGTRLLCRGLPCGSRRVARPAAGDARRAAGRRRSAPRRPGSGTDTTFRAVAQVGRGPGLITIYSRAPRGGARPAPRGASG